MSATADRNVELAERLRSLRERIRTRIERPAPAVPELDLPSLDALRNTQAGAHRLASQIGTVNPRQPGLANALIQTAKRSLARVLDWHVRPQRDFNHAVLESIAEVAQVLEEIRQHLKALAEAGQSWSGSHQELVRNIDLLGEQLEQQVKLQRWSLEGAFHRQFHSLQEEFRPQIEKLHDEVRLLRQRLAARAQAEAARAVGDVSPVLSRVKGPVPSLDYFALEKLFRGTEQDIRERQRFYLPYFQGRRNVLDLACGRGEFLELMREANVPARGVDLDADMVGRCVEKGLQVTEADVFAFLDAVPDRSLDGIFSAHFVEHLDPDRYVALIARCAEKLAPAGLLAIETPNPECLAIFSQSFFIDPTHVRPVPPAQLRFLFGEAGLERIRAHFLAPAGAALPLMPALFSHKIEPEALRTFNAAVAKFNETFFGGMDYAVLGYRPGSA